MAKPPKKRATPQPTGRMSYPRWREGPHPTVLVMPGGGPAVPAPRGVRQIPVAAPAPAPTRQGVGVQQNAPSPRRDYEAEIWNRVQGGFPQPTEPYPGYIPEPVVNRRAPSRPHREQTPAPKRNLKGEGREAAKAGFLALLLGSLFGGGTTGGLMAANGALSGFGQGADKSDAERRRVYEDELFAGDVDYQNAIADWGTASDQLGLDTQTDAIRRGENQFGFGAKERAYGAGFNERSATNQANQFNTGVLGDLRGQNITRDMGLLDAQMKMPGYVGELGALDPATQKSLGTRTNRIGERLGVDGGFLPVPGARSSTGVNPLFKPGLEQQGKQAVINRENAMAEYLKPEFNLKERQQKEVERANKAHESLQRYEIDQRALDRKVKNGQASEADGAAMRASMSRLNSLDGRRKGIVAALKQSGLDPTVVAELNVQLDEIRAAEDEEKAVIETIRARNGFGKATPRPVGTIDPASLVPPPNPIAGIGSGFSSFMPGNIGVVPGGVPAVTIDPGTGRPFARPTPQKRDTKKKTAPTPRKRPEVRGTMTQGSNSYDYTLER